MICLYDIIILRSLTDLCKRVKVDIDKVYLYTAVENFS